MASCLHGLVSTIAAPHGRYVAASVYRHAKWGVYVAHESEAGVVRWWGRPVSWEEVQASPDDVCLAWSHVSIEIGDYDTPDEDEEIIQAPCVLNVYTEVPLRLELPPCPDRTAATISAFALAELARQSRAQHDAARMQTDMAERTISDLNAELSAERTKYREVCIQSTN